MSIKIEPPYRLAKVPSIVTIILSAISLVGHYFEYRVAHWPFDAEYIIVNSVIICWGIVFPAIVITLCIIGNKIYEQSEYITLAFGIAITVISGILIFISTRWVVANIINIVEHTASPGLIVIYAIQLSLVAVILAMQIKALIGGIRLIKYYQGGA